MKFINHYTNRKITLSVIIFVRYGKKETYLDD